MISSNNGKIREKGRIPIYANFNVVNVKRYFCFFLTHFEEDNKNFCRVNELLSEPLRLTDSMLSSLDEMRKVR